MKRIGLAAFSFMLVAIFGVSAFAQTSGAQAAAGRIGWINTTEFGDEKTGITRFVNAYKVLAGEVKLKETEMVAMQTKLQGIASDLDKLRSNPVADPAAIAAKQDEGEKLQRDLKYKKEDYDAFVQKRSNALLGPIQADIGKAIQEFAKQKGYTAILDIDKLGQAGAILALDSTANISKDFIAFYNARPATAAAVAAPK